MSHPTPKREGTMAQTAKEGKEYLKANKVCDCPLEGLKGSDECPKHQTPTAKRQGTMEATAEEGIEYLKAERADTLLEVQGLAKREGKSQDTKNGEEPEVSKQRTMGATAEEGEMLVEWMGGKLNPEARTRGQQKELDEKDEAPPSKKPKVARDSTMTATAKEANQHIIKDKKIGETRSETAVLNEEEDTPTPKKTHTMKETTAEAEQLVQGDLGGTRSDTKAVKSVEEETTPVKRQTTMEKTAKEGAEFTKRKH